MSGQVFATLSEFGSYGLSSLAVSGVSDAQILASLAAASDEASGYLAAQYELPLISWGYDLRRAVSVLAAADIMAVRGYSNTEADARLEERAKAVREWLSKVASGLVSLTQVVDSSPSTQNGGARVYTAERRGW